MNTITPLVSGLLVPRFGAAKVRSSPSIVRLPSLFPETDDDLSQVGLVATGCVFFGQLIVVWAQSGGEEQSVGWMVRPATASLLRTPLTPTGTRYRLLDLLLLA